MFKTSSQFLLLIILFCYHSSVGFNRFEFKINHGKYCSGEQLEVYLDSIVTGNYLLPDSVQEYNNCLLSEKKEWFQKENIFSKVYYLIEIAQTNEYLNDQQTAYQNIEEALRLIPYENFPSLHFKVLETAGEIARKHRDYETLTSYLKRMYNTGFLSDSSIHLSDILLEIADYNWNMHNYDESMLYCDKVMPLLQQQNYEEGKIKALIIMYHNAHFSTNDSTWSTYLLQALKIAEDLGDSTQLSKVYFNIGYSHYRESEHTKAINYYKKAREFEKEKGSASELQTTIMQQLSYTLIDSVEAVNKTSAYLISQAIKNKHDNVLGNAYRGRAWYFAKTGQKDSAVYYLNKAYEHRQSYNEKKKASPGFYRYLYEVAMLIPDYELALRFLNISSAQTRQISMETNAKELSSARADFDYQLQRERIERLSLENQLQSERNKRQKIIITAISLIFLFGIMFLLFAQKKYAELRFSFRELVKRNKELDKLNLKLSNAENQLRNNGNANGKQVKDEDLLYIKLKRLFEEEHIYRKHNLSIRELAEILETNTTYLSTIINQRFELPFKALLNKYRVNEARIILETKQYAHLTIEGIAEKVGYHSRSTFYNAFKEITGLTPTQYMNSMMNEL